MTTNDLNLMKAMVQDMKWREERQKILAQNIANADTPDYKPQDLTPLRFKDLLRSSTSSLPTQTLGASSLAATDKQHLSVGGRSSSNMTAKAKDSRDTYEVAPAGNAVVLEEQLLKANENMVGHRFTTNLYQKNVDMLKMTLRQN